MESKKINQLATELTPALSDLTIIGDPTTGISKKITLSQMASLFTGTVEEYANLAAFPLVGVADTIYIALDTNILYRWNTGTSAYVELSPNIVSSLVFNDANGFDGTINLVGSVATLTITTALTSGSVPFIGASGALTQDNANLFFDDTNNRLGIATASPTTPLDVFGSGIIGRLNATSTNNAYLGFASNGTNKWSAGNVQSDHRFRIFSEANSAELITILQTGEFGIGIANPLTKFHIDGGTTALIANLDANVSVAKSISFRSDNSNRINLEVSGTESGSNAGADFFIRRYSDAGSLIDTPLTITRSTGGATFSGILTTPQVKAATSAGLSINANSGTQVADFGAGGSANMTLFGGLSGTSASFSSTATATAFIPSGATVPTNGMYLSAANTLNFATNSTNALTIISTGFMFFGSVPSATNYVKYNFNVGTDLNIGFRSASGIARLEATNDAVAANIPMEFTASRFNFSSGNVGINTSSPLNKLDVRQASAAMGDYQTIQAFSTDSAAINLGGGISLGGYFTGTTSIAQFGSIVGRKENGTSANYDGYLAFGTNAQATGVVERMRIKSNGDVIIGTTPTANGHNFFMESGNGAYQTIGHPAGASTGYSYTLYHYNSSPIGSIAQSGTTAVVFNTTSDYRLKEVISPIQNSIDTILKLKPINFKWKNTEDEYGQGFLAHELQEIIPLSVTGEKDAVNEDGSFKLQQVDHSKLVPYLVKAIQEQQAQIEELKAKIK